jgi:hypothetical protein
MPRLFSLAVALCAVFTAVSMAAPGAGPVAKRDTVVVDEKTEATIKGALKWLAAQQKANGSWGSSGEEQRHPIAVTAYVLMTFQSAGHLPGEGEYGRQVAAGLQYLLDQMATDGIYGQRHDGQYMYSHGIATIALAELYGQTRSAVIRQKLDRAIKLIISSQNEEGGWRYRPIAKDADMSVTVLQVVALRAAKNSGIEVPQKTIDGAVKYVRSCYSATSGGFGYQPGGSPGFARTAAAIYSLQVCGLYDDPQVRAGSDYLFKNNREEQEWFVYGNFYAAPAHYMIGGPTWEKWYAQIKERLYKSIKKEGDTYSWESKGHGGVGPVYTTAVFTMILAMPYHYLPLYQR